MRKIVIKIPPALASMTRLDHAIAASPESVAQNFSRGFIRKLIVAGAVYVNGRRVRIASKALRGGEVIDMYWDKDRSPEKLSADKFLPLRTLYDDEAVICFDKPAGLPTQPTLDESRLNLYVLAKQQLDHQRGKPGYLGMHHRLDRDTSGVILFTQDKKYNAFIADQFKEHTCTKLYVALVHGKLPKPSGRLESFLGPVSKRGKQARFGSVRSGGKKAITEYSVLDQNSQFSLVEVKITTGRTHQIRVHFSELGHAIVGDTLYGSPAKYYDEIKRHLLHAHALTITHPITKNLIRIESPVPQELRKWISTKP